MLPILRSLLLSLSLPTVGSAALAETGAAGTQFTVEEGFRVTDCMVPRARQTDDGRTRLYVHCQGWDMVLVSRDGLSFGPKLERKDADLWHPTNVRVAPDLWRRFKLAPSGEISTRSSEDGENYEAEPGIAYEAPESDGELGVFDIFKDHRGNLRMLYVGEMGKANNLRAAVSHDRGETWTFTDGDVLHDKGLKPQETGVDPYVVKVSRRKRRLFVMKGGVIHSYLSKNGGRSFDIDEGLVLAPSDFPDLDVVTLHDPVILRLPDGRFRMYVCARIKQDDGSIRQVIVSAISR